MKLRIQTDNNHTDKHFTYNLELSSINIAAITLTACASMLTAHWVSTHYAKIQK